jgi:hypothetical protein
MARKKWTPISEATAAISKVREKKKWQIALRRYVLEQKPCLEYAPYFGIDIKGFREWISLQFQEGNNWDNFGSKWQFDHIVPMHFFDFEKEHECRLCWNFVNIRVGETGSTHRKTPEQLVEYFRELFEKTGYSVCREISQHIENQTNKHSLLSSEAAAFIAQNRSRLETLKGFSPEHYYDLNKGVSLESILLEISILNKYGSPSE